MGVRTSVGYPEEGWQRQVPTHRPELLPQPQGNGIYMYICIYVCVDCRTTSESRDSVTFGSCQTSESRDSVTFGSARRQSHVTVLHLAVPGRRVT